MTSIRRKSLFHDLRNWGMTYFLGSSISGVSHPKCDKLLHVDSVAANFAYAFFLDFEHSTFGCAELIFDGVFADTWQTEVAHFWQVSQTVLGDTIVPFRCRSTKTPFLLRLRFLALIVLCHLFVSS